MGMAFNMTWSQRMETAGLLHNTALSTADKTNSSEPGSLVIPFLDVLIIKIRVDQI